MNEPKLTEILKALGIKPLGKNGRGWIYAKCPFAEFKHDKGSDSKPSFFVKVDGHKVSGFHCFTCKSKGRVSSMVRQLSNLREEDYGDLATQADLAEIDVDFTPFEYRDTSEELQILDPETYLMMYPLAKEEKEARDYLISRGIGKIACDALDLRYDPDVHRIVFPVKGPEGELFGFTGRTVLDMDRYDVPKVKDYEGLQKELVMLGMHLYVPGKPIIIVEGLFALAHFIQIGVSEYANVFATMGSDMTKGHADWLIDYFDEETFLCYDMDEAGEIGIYGQEKAPGVPHKDGAIKLLKGSVKLRVMLYPKGVSDPDKLNLKQVLGMLRKHHEIII